MKKTFGKKKAGCKDVNKFQIGELVWFNVQRWMPDMKHNKAKWIGPCKVVSMSNKNCLSYHMRLMASSPNTTVYTHSSISGLVENLY